MNYLESVKYLIDNFIFTTITDEYKESARDDSHIINRPSKYFNDLLNQYVYSISGSSEFYHNRELTDYYINNNIYIPNYDLKTSLSLNKKVIIQLDFHPGSRSFNIIRNNFFDNLFKDYPELLSEMKLGNAYLFLYFGFEADSFYYNDYNNVDGNLKNYYELFDNVIIDYGLPNTSMIILSSNMLGYEQERIQYGDDTPLTTCIFDNVTEYETFTRATNTIDVNYSFEKHIENLKKSTKYLLRVNRTTNQYRDLMLYYLYKSNNIDKCIVEHIKFGVSKSQLINLLLECRDICNLNGFIQLSELFEYDESVYDKIINSLPHLTNDTDNLVTNHYGIEPISHDVYHKTLFSWVSTSLLDKDNQVFINASTFSPMLYYHPLLIHGNRQHIEKIKESGYNSYDWIFDESHDLDGSALSRFVKSTNSVDYLLSKSKDDIIDILIKNKDKLINNRNKLLRTDSIENIITKFVRILV